jgi:hypothetical protein
MTTTTATHYWSATAAATCGSVVVFAVDEEEKIATTKTHEPGFQLTHEERMKKCDQHKYGICVSCDAGLDDRADFTCDPRMPGGFALMCHACGDYYNKNGYVSCGYGPFSNAAYR